MSRISAGPSCRLAATILAAAAICHAASDGRFSSTVQPFSLLENVVVLDDRDRRDLDRGETLVKTLDPRDPSHLVVFAAARVETTPARFARAIRNFARLLRGRDVPRSGTLTPPFDADDVGGMRLWPQDLAALRECRPGDCALKLSESEMSRAQDAIAAALDTRVRWEAEAQSAFRRIVLDRLRAYAEGGLFRLGPFHDQDLPFSPQATFAGLLVHSTVLQGDLLEAAEYLQRYPRAPLPAGMEEHFYWLETVQTPKPTLQVVHQVIDTRASSRSTAGAAHIEAAAVSRQIFATHYLNGSIAVTLLMRADDATRYVFYINRSDVDGLGGWISGVRRYFMERRVRGAAREAFNILKREMEK